ncbi:hypothetical protein JXQ70_19900 [bacterium]|nr:hypothetical protein [bacterium]
MPTYRNDGTNAVTYRPIIGGLKRLCEPGQTCQTYEILDILSPDSGLVKVSDEPYRLNDYYELDFDFANDYTKTVRLTADQVRDARKIILVLKTTGQTVKVYPNYEPEDIDPDLAISPPWRVLDFDAGFTRIEIKCKRDIALITLIASDDAYVDCYVTD